MKVVMSVCLSPEIYEKLKEHSKKTYRNMSQTIQLALEKYFSAEEK